MNDNIKTSVSIITLLIMVSSMVFTAGQMWHQINENTSSIIEHKLSTKEIRHQGNRLTELEANAIHFKATHLLIYDDKHEKDADIEKIHNRLRIVESDIATLKAKSN